MNKLLNKFLYILIGLFLLANIVLAIVWVSRPWLAQAALDYFESHQQSILQSFYEATGLDWHVDVEGITWQRLNPQIQLSSVVACYQSGVRSLVDNESEESAQDSSELCSLRMQDASVSIDVASVLLKRSLSFGAISTEKVELVFFRSIEGVKLAGYRADQTSESDIRVNLDSINQLYLSQIAVSTVEDESLWTGRYSWTPHKINYHRSKGRALFLAQPNEQSKESITLKLRRSPPNDPHASLAQGWSGFISVGFSNDGVPEQDGVLNAYDTLDVIVSSHENKTDISALLFAGNDDEAHEYSTNRWPPLWLTGEASIGPALKFLQGFATEPSEDWIQLNWSPIAGEDSRVPIESGSLSLGKREGEPQLLISQRAIGLDALAKQVELLLRPGEKFVDLVDRLEPSGSLDYFQIALPLARPQDFYIHGQLNGVSVESINAKAVNAKNVSGLFSLNRQGGVLRLLPNEAPSGITFPATYQRPLWFYPDGVELQWFIDVDRFYIGGERLILRYTNSLNNTGIAQGGEDASDTLELHGRFWTDIRRDKRLRSSELDLEIGVANQANLQDLLDFVPDSVPPSLKRWIKNSDLSGRASDVDFLYRGSLSRKPGAKRLYALNAEFQDASLNYLDLWPAARGLSGNFLLVDGDVDASIGSAAFGTETRDKVLSLSGSSLRLRNRGGESRLSFEGSVKDSLPNLINFLEATPVQQVLPEQLSIANVQGLVDARFDLALPVSPAPDSKTATDIAEDQQVWDTVDLGFTGRLSGGSFDAIPGLRVDGVSGSLRFDAGDGFAGTQLNGRLLGRPVSFSVIAPDASSDTSSRNWRGKTLVAADGGFTTDALFSAFDISEVLPISGEASAAGTITLGDGQTSVTLKSNLTGVTFDFPEPFRKAAPAVLGSTLQWRANGEQRTLSASLGEWLSVGTDDFRDFAASSYKVNLFPNEKQGLVSGLQDYPAYEVLENTFSLSPAEVISQRQPRLVVGGYLPVFDWDEWLDALSAIQDGPTENKEFPLDGFRVHSLLVDQITYGETTLDASLFSLFFAEEDIFVDFQNSLISGSLALPLAVLEDFPVCGREETTEESELVGLAERLPVAESDPASAASMPSLPDVEATIPRLALGLNYINLPAPELNTDQGSSVFDRFFAPGCLPNAYVDIGSIELGDRKYGSWRFMHTGGENIGLIHAIDGRIDSTSISSAADEGLLWAGDANGQVSSSLSMELFSTGIDKVLVDNAAVAQSPLFADNSYVDAALHWSGTPHQFSWSELAGSINFELTDGRFVEVPTVASGFLKIVSVVNVQRYLSRLDFSFSEVVSEGVGFDSLNGRLDFDGGKVAFQEKPIVMSAASSDFQMQGAVNLLESRIDADLVATLPIGSNLPWLAALAGGLPIAAGTFIATQAFDKEFSRFSSVVYEVKGKIDEPEVSLKQVFSDGSEVNESASDSVRMRKHKRR